MKKYFSIPQAAKLCSVDRSTMHRWVSSGKIKSYSTAGGHKRILPEDLEEWLLENGMPFEIDEIKNVKTRILIVDDDIHIQHYLKNLLKGLLVEIETASNGFEAGKKLIQFKPDLMVLDLLMPDIDGFEVCKIVKQDHSTRKIKILILSGHGSLENIKKATRLGADAFLSKPSSKKEILECVERLLMKH